MASFLPADANLSDDPAEGLLKEILYLLYIKATTTNIKSEAKMMWIIMWMTSGCGIWATMSVW